jgi:excinuclease UvrABC ATPase subunit
LIHGSVSGRDGVVSVDQGAIRGSRRSNPATYSKLLDAIRKAFAKANGVKPALFSANSEGACPTCDGAGVIYTDLAMMAGVASTCEECEGKRFEASVLDYHLGGRDISEVLAMSVTEAEEFFGAGDARTPAAHAILERLADVGLGYLTIGQPLTTPSGIAVQQQRDHHRRLVRRTAPAVVAISGVERGEIRFGDCLDHEPRQVPLGQPLTQTRRHNSSCSRSHPRKF